MIRPSGRPVARACLMVVVVALAVLPGCGGDAPGSSDGSLAWAGRPQVRTPPELPRDRLLIGRLKNESLREARLDADRARLVDEQGREVTGTVRFTGSFGHGLYSPRRSPAGPEPESERRRLGELAVVRPGETVPVTLSWRLGKAGRHPARLEVGALQVELPAR